MKVDHAFQYRVVGRMGVQIKRQEAHLWVLASPPLVNTTLAPALRTFSIPSFVIQILCEAKVLTFKVNYMSPSNRK
jgi:hypothetical protein